MFGKVFGEYKNVVEIDCDLSFGNEVAEDVIHHPLEYCVRVGESKEHDGRLKQSSVHAEGGFLFVPFLDPDIVVSPMNIKLCEVLCTTKLVNEFRD